MKAIVLAAGLGTRLKPITNKIPKCLVEINGRPLLGKWLDDLSNSGVNEILINTHYLSDQVLDYLSKSKYRDLVEISHEKKLLGTAGTLIKNLDFFENEGGLLIHADNYCNLDLKSFYLAHKNRPATCELTIVTFNTTDPQNCGILEMDKNGIVFNIFEKVKIPKGNIANGAIYFLSPSFIQILRENHSNSIDFVNDILINYLGKIFTFHTNDLFVDIGTPEALNSLKYF